MLQPLSTNLHPTLAGIGSPSSGPCERSTCRIGCPVYSGNQNVKIVDPSLGITPPRENSFSLNILNSGTLIAGMLQSRSEEREQPIVAALPSASPDRRFRLSTLG